MIISAKLYYKVVRKLQYYSECQERINDVYEFQNFGAYCSLMTKYMHIWVEIIDPIKVQCAVTYHVSRLIV